jgi:sodium/hydrogen antiporter
MPTLAVNNFNIVVSVLGGWVSLFGLVSYLCKENFYLSEARMYYLAPPHPCSYLSFLPGLGA